MSRRPDLRTACADLLQVLFVVWVALLVVAIVHGHTVDEVEGAPWSLERLRKGNGIAPVINEIGVWLYLLTALVFVTWLFQESKRCEVAEVPRSFGPGWAVWGWCIPIASLVIPLEVTKEIWVASAGRLRPRPFTIVHAWWVCLLAAGAFRVPSALALAPVWPDPLAFDRHLWALSPDGWDEIGSPLPGDYLLLAAAVLALVVVRRVSRAVPCPGGRSAHIVDGPVAEAEAICDPEKEQTTWRR